MRLNPSGRQGLALVELLIGLVLFALVGALVQVTLFRESRLARARSELIGLTGTLRLGAALLPGELRELGAAGDIITIGADSLTYRALRTAGLACQVSPNEILVSTTLLGGFRQLQPGRDSLLLFIEGDSPSAADDSWLPLPLFGVATGRVCGGRPALGLATTLDTVLTPLARIHLDAPLRTFEVMQLRLYPSGGQFWLGARSVSAGETIQPVLGPLTGAGLQLTYLDSTGTLAVGPASVRSVQLVVRGTTSHPVVSGGGSGPLAFKQDTISTEVLLRNAPGQ